MVETDEKGISTATPDGPDTWLLRYDNPGGTVLDLSPLPAGAVCQSHDALFTGTQDECNAKVTELGLTH
jgi:hypothetical protein